MEDVIFSIQIGCINQEVGESEEIHIACWVAAIYLDRTTGTRESDPNGVFGALGDVVI